MSSESDADDEYVHTPGDERDIGADVGPITTEPEGVGRRGWVLVAALIVSVLVIPGIIYAYPYAAGSFGLTFYGTYLLLPLIPAVLLGVLAVWSLGVVGETE
ncbi:hypothetical protein [Halorubrum sp. DTA98]|uniref:hypothetical protein n=1 Tax=Halorubrum sp. DTA98 TaxID=3402163 RepID=UPI003AAD8CC6